LKNTRKPCLVPPPSQTAPPLRFHPWKRHKLPELLINLNSLAHPPEKGTPPVAASAGLFALSNRSGQWGFRICWKRLYHRASHRTIRSRRGRLYPRSVCRILSRG
jgi:hypothetical protein